MILTIDIGNTAVSFEFAEESKKKFFAITENKVIKTEKDYIKFLTCFSKTKNIKFSIVKKVALCSVVDSIEKTIVKVIAKLFKLKPIILDYKAFDKIRIAVDKPQTLGTDMIATAIGASSQWKNDICVIDCGTTTTLSLISKDKTFLSYSIMPGVNLQLESLAKNTFKLPSVESDFSKDLLGKNTNDAILAGVIRGQANAINYFIKILKVSFPNICIVVTGGLSKDVKEYFNFKFIFSQNLIHKGLKEFIKNK